VNKKFLLSDFLREKKNEYRDQRFFSIGILKAVKTFLQLFFVVIRFLPLFWHPVASSLLFIVFSKHLKKFKSYKSYYHGRYFKML
jgi:hypothetical protein